VKIKSLLTPSEVSEVHDGNTVTLRGPRTMTYTFRGNEELCSKRIKLSEPTDQSATSRFKEGDRVMVWWQLEKNFFSGEVTRHISGEFYDVNYDGKFF